MFMWSFGPLEKKPSASGSGHVHILLLAEAAIVEHLTIGSGPAGEVHGAIA